MAVNLRGKTEKIGFQPEYFSTKNRDLIPKESTKKITIFLTSYLHGFQNGMI